MIDFGRIPQERLPALLRMMPKAELHIHIDGSLEPEMIFALAKRNGVGLNYPSIDALRAAYAFSDLQSFLDIYYAGASVLLTEQDFFDLGFAYLQKASAENVRCAEIFFDPQTHTARGVAMKDVILGLSHACHRAHAESGLQAKLTGRISSQISYDLRYQDRPLFGKEETDTVTRIGLTYDF